jgi:hypothetical protein
VLEVVDARPPNYEAVVAVLPGAAQPGVMFAYGGKVYAPGRTSISPELQAHEQVHIDRQGADTDAWWARYLVDVAFRFDEEVLAHRAEWKRYCARHIDQFKRQRALAEIAGKLASGLYGVTISRSEAMAAIKG